MYIINVMLTWNLSFVILVVVRYATLNLIWRYIQFKSFDVDTI